MKSEDGFGFHYEQYKGPNSIKTIFLKESYYPVISFIPFHMPYF